MQATLDRHAASRFALGLGLFSIGLGLVELLWARPLARSLGMKGDEGLLRFYGVREIATGMGLLAARDRAPWLWARVAGDALDLATLASKAPGSPRKGALAVATGAVAGATALDVVTARSLERAEAPWHPARARRIAHDYGDRSGFPRGVDASRGLARKDFQVPPDMRDPWARGETTSAPPRPTAH